MTRVFLFTRLVIAFRHILKDGSFVRAFIGIILIRGFYSGVLWYSRIPLLAVIVFLVISGSIMCIFGFMLCLCPWEIASKKNVMVKIPLRLAWIVGILFGFQLHLWNGRDSVGKLGERVPLEGVPTEAVLGLGSFIFIIMPLLIGVRVWCTGQGTLRR